MPARQPLRYSVPVLIFLAGALLLAVYAVVEWFVLERRLYEDGEQELKRIATMTGGSVEAAFRHGRESEARAALERISGDPSIAHALLVDAQGRVVLSSRPGARSAHISTSEFAGFEQFIGRDMRGISLSKVPEEKSVQGIFPVAIRTDGNTLLPQHVGWLLLEYDLKRRVNALRNDLVERVLLQALLLLGLCVGLWGVFRRLLLERIQRLIHATRAVGKGNFTVRPDVSGNDEIAELAREFRGMVRHLQSHAEEISFLAEHDSVTGLFNRTGFETVLNVALQGVRARGKQFIVAQIDIDSFRVINDTQGHAAGDELLRSFARLLQQAFPEAVALARLGGDDFVVLVELDGGLTSQELVQQVHAAVEAFRFDWNRERFAVQVRIGIVALQPSMIDADQVLGYADIAYHASRESGHERVAVWDPSIEDMASRHGQMRWVSRIQSALDDGRFELFAQQIMPVDPSIDEALHFEVLVRMCDERGQLVPPGEFLGAAERYNLVGHVDRWVIENAFNRLFQRPDVLGRLGMCSINLSGLSFGNPAILEAVRRALADNPALLPRKICFEVTETAAITHLGQAARFIDELRALGCSFALDDFGSGVSSFGYLKNLPVDFVKIDGMFVRDMLNDPADRAIVASINDIAHGMGKRTIAEFAESRAVIDELRRIGVDYVQGYGVAKPVRMDRLLAQASAHGHVGAE